MEGVAPKLNMTEAQAATLARYSALENFKPMKSAIEAAKNPTESVAKFFKPQEFDLHRISAMKLALMNASDGTTNALAGLGTYNTISALDRSIDPKTGKPVSYLQSIIDHNYVNPTNNVLFDAMTLGVLSSTFKGGTLKKTLLRGNNIESSLVIGTAPLNGSIAGARSLNYYGKDLLIDHALRAGFMGAATSAYRNPQALQQVLIHSRFDRTEENFIKREGEDVSDKKLKMQ